MIKNGPLVSTKISLYAFSFFYVGAGVNHFINPDFYLGLIPDYLPYHETINYMSGVLEIIIGLAVLNLKTRKIASLLTIIMLVAFIPSHIFFIKIGSCVDNGLCVSSWIAWFRLLVIHPLLIIWALSVGKIRIRGLF
ncbi:MAG: putative membrane protein [Marivirga sp.]|jgi:uncharacterized membrane protein